MAEILLWSIVLYHVDVLTGPDWLPRSHGAVESHLSVGYCSLCVTKVLVTCWTLLLGGARADLPPGQHAAWTWSSSWPSAASFYIIPVISSTFAPAPAPAVAPAPVSIPQPVEDTPEVRGKKSYARSND